MILVGDVMSMIATIPSDSIDCVVTSPPYWGLRDYGADGQLGLEPTPEMYVGNMRMIFEQVRRVLKPQGTLWLNLGDIYVSYPGNRGASIGKANRRHHDIMPSIPARSGLSCKSLKNKDLVGIPWRVAFALQSDGWYLRQDIIWHKPNPMPESVRDRCTKAHEYIFLLSKSARYYFDYEVIKEPAKYGWRGSEFHTGKTGEHQLGRAQKVRPSVAKGGFKSKGEPLPGRLPFRAIREWRNKRSVWTVATRPFKGAHFATFPPDLIEPCILAGCPPGGTVLDPFFGAGTTGLVAKKHGRNWIGIELNEAYAQMAQERMG
jgi:DNA modification methylase